MRSDSSRRKRATRIAAAVTLAETIGVWLRSGRPGGNIVVRCRDGHLFTTLWLPAISVKALRLGLWRFQRCPVGHHWSIVTPVKASSLSPAELRAARSQHDVRIP
jgi:hypothetical protein